MILDAEKVEEDMRNLKIADPKELLQKSGVAPGRDIGRYLGFLGEKEKWSILGNPTKLRCLFIFDVSSGLGLSLGLAQSLFCAVITN